MLAALSVTLAISGWDNLAPIPLLVVPCIAAWAVRRVSVLVALYLAQIAVGFGVTALVLDDHPSSLLIAIVLLWTLGLCVGSLVGRTKVTSTPERAWVPPMWPQFALVAVLVAIQAYLALSAQLGYAAQYSLGLATPTDALGILATAGPVVSLMLLITAFRARRGLTGALMLAASQAIVLSLTGFRGTAGFFAIAAFAAGALAIPKGSPWLRPRRMTLVVATIVLFAAGGFIVGANVRSAAATRLGNPTQLFGLNQAVSTVSTRLDLGAPLQAGIDSENDPNVEAALSWTSQIQTFIPRFLWPDKPTTAYGQLVSVTVYGLQYGETSSTITTIGDVLVNSKIPGVIVVSLLLGFALTRAERRVRRAKGVFLVVLAAVLADSILGLEAPLIVLIATALRNLLVSAVLWRASQTLCAARREHIA
jgi:hypothetical protein